MSEGAGNNEALAGSIVTARFAPASKMIVFSPEAATVMSAVPRGSVDVAHVRDVHAVGSQVSA